MLHHIGIIYYLNLQRISLYPAPVRLAIFVLILLLIWLPFAAPIALFLREDPNLVTILTMGLLFFAFQLLLWWWGKKIHKQNHVFRHYGLSCTQRNRLRLHQGLTIGLLSTAALFSVQGSLGWLEFQTPSITLPRIVMEGFLCGLGVALAEELFFRGWLLDELSRDYTPSQAVWLNGGIFGLLHYLQPPEQMIANALAFPGLVLMGMTLVWAKHRAKGLLGLPIGIHGGMVWGYYILNVGQLIQYTEKVPTWVTGINGHPFAGIMGFGCLLLLAWGMRIK